MSSRPSDDRYQRGEALGEGGMAVVYKATDLHLRRPVALKLLRDQFAADPDCVERFQREARAAAALSHPNIVAVYDLGSDGSTHLIAMEHVEGEDLKRILRREGPLGTDKTLRLGIQIAEALEYAHEHGVIHRDVKPQNVLVTPQGHAKVADFGIAVALGAPSLTPSGTVLGTAHYLSPEQARGQECTPASDVYSLGVVLYEMATGRVPFEADNPAAIAHMHLEKPIAPGLRINSAVPRGLREILGRALEKDAAQRFRSAADLAEEMKRYLAHLEQPTVQEEAPRRPPAFPFRSWAARSLAGGRQAGGGGQVPLRREPPSGPIAVIVLAMVLLAVTIGAAVGVVNMSRQAEATTEALAATATALADARTTATAGTLAISTAGARAAATATAGILAVATAGARVEATALAVQETVAVLAAMAPTATAQAGTEAAVRSAQATLVALGPSLQRMHSVDDGRLDHRPEGVTLVILTERLGPFNAGAIQLRNFWASVRLFNPYDPAEGAWDYGLLFRGTGEGEGYRLYIDSSGSWHLDLASTAAGKIVVDSLASGEVKGAHLSRHSSNLLSITVNGDTALLHVNGEYVATLPVSHRDLAGEVGVATGFARGNSLSGRATRFQDFRVWALR